MPQLNKRVINQYFKTGCQRQMRLRMSPPDNVAFRPEREAQAMPEPQKPRPGISQIQQEGADWELQKYTDLALTYGAAGLLANYDVRSKRPYHNQELAVVLPTATANQFLIEAQYEVLTGFTDALGISEYHQPVAEGGLDLSYTKMRPDIIQVLPPASRRRGIQPDGSEVKLATDDPRQQLRVIDIKLVAEPSEGYFAEVSFYMMVLAGWLQAHKLDSQFVVVEGAVWPGSHEASKLRQAHAAALREVRQPTVAELNAALDEDLEVAEFPVFALRLRRFLQEELPQILSEADWRDLPFYVRTSCSRCDYLGYQWRRDEADDDSISADHCIPTITRSDDLCQVYQLTPGARQQLREGRVVAVGSLAGLDFSDGRLDEHQTLRARRKMFPARARSLNSGVMLKPQDVGKSAVMPRWSDLSIYLTADFDAGSGITVAFGFSANWRQPIPYGETLTERTSQRWEPTVYPVDARNVDVERRELLAFLHQIQQVFNYVAEQDKLNSFNAGKEEKDWRTRSTAQVYIWDSLQLKQLQRAISRHLPAILAEPAISNLPWLFPSEVVLANDELQRASPLTIVQEAVTSLVALPLPYVYTLLDTVLFCHSASTEAQPNWRNFYNVHPLFEGPLSDQIPSERAHEIWSRSTTPKRSWHDQLKIYKETVQTKLRALREVTEWLQRELKDRLPETAPNFKVRPPRTEKAISVDGDFWLAFARLDANLDQLETLAIRAMPSYEREARFHSAMLTERLNDDDANRELARLKLPPARCRRVYRLAAGSLSVKLKDGDFQFALAPDQDGSFLNRSYYKLRDDHPELPGLRGKHPWKLEGATKVTVRKLDRENGIVVLDAETYEDQGQELCLLDTMERLGLADFSQNVSLEPISDDFFTGKLKECLSRINNPPIAEADPQVKLAMGQLGPSNKSKRQVPHLPADDFLWAARAMAMAGTHSLLLTETTAEIVQATLEQQGTRLTDTQWKAWRGALGNRLQLIWGPPGTGKSRTLQAVVAGAFAAATATNRPLRVLICASTYTAIDNVLHNTIKSLNQNLAGRNFFGCRLRSSRRESDGSDAEQFDLVLSNSAEASDLCKRLLKSDGLTLVGATPEQTYNLWQTANGGKVPSAKDKSGELFDLIVIDEASQMDIMHAILPISALATGGSVVLAGDHLQLPPIHKAEAPDKLENYIGSVYNYAWKRHGVEPLMLDVNYRSNRTLVEFTLEAGYQEALAAHSPDLKLRLAASLSKVQPSGWPNGLCWTPLWNELLNPDRPASCFVYRDGKSSQWNEFEVEAVAALVQSVYGNVLEGLAGENNPRSEPKAEAYATADFWKQAVGIVTPHRAQQSRIVSRLQQLFGNGSPELRQLIAGAVDTVERFQGQQRDIIIASYALGDPDAIANEEEFLMSLNRFNVMASRARAKLIVLVSREVVDHLASDMDVLRESRLLKVFAESFCTNPQQVNFDFVTKQGRTLPIRGELRSR